MLLVQLIQYVESSNNIIFHKFLVSKKTVVLCRWKSETWKFCFIKRVDKSRITNEKDLESWRFECQPFVRAKG